MKKYENTVKITLKYDDGKEKVSLEVDAIEMDIFLENEYQQRLSISLPEERAMVRKLTPKEYADKLNRESYNNWRLYNRHISGPIKNICVEEGDESFINPLELIEDKVCNKRLEESVELDVMRQILYSHLPKKQADLLWAIAIDDVPVAEIAKREGVSLQAIYYRLETARKNAKKFFKNP